MNLDIEIKLASFEKKFKEIEKRIERLESELYQNIDNLEEDY
jgi:chaperonin cofactor prefoldin